MQARSINQRRFRNMLSLKHVIAVGLVMLLTACAGSGTGVKPAAETGAKESQAAEPKVDPKALAANEAALSAMRNGDDAGAEKLFLQMAKDFPAYSGPYTNLGILYFRAGKMDKAEPAFLYSLEINPKNAVSLNYLGIIERNKGRFKEAHEFYDKALQVDPDYAYAHRNFGILLELYMGKLGEAMDHYKRYQELTKEEDQEVKKWIADLGRRVSAKN